jgi:hypothetical protein
MKRLPVNVLKGLALLYATGVTVSVRADEVAAQTLLAQYPVLEERLSQNQFMRPVILDSLESANKVTGEIYVITPHPFAAVSAGLNDPEHWCDVLSLHINTKYCRTAQTSAGVMLNMYVGRKTPQDLQDAEQLGFVYTPSAQTPTYLAIGLNAPKGPIGTHDYRIDLEAVPLPGGSTFLHLTYSYSMGFAARVAVKAYLATIGKGKVGFTADGTDREGQPRLIGGVRALVERNTMRYYLAIDSFLAVAAEAPSAQLDLRLHSWFSSVEQYPQLYELDRAEYVAMKHDEQLRQQRVN